MVIIYDSSASNNDEDTCSCQDCSCQECTCGQFKCADAEEVITEEDTD